MNGRLAQRCRGVKPMAVLAAAAGNPQHRNVRGITVAGRVIWHITPGMTLRLVSA
jgi:hypothetical protein